MMTSTQIRQSFLDFFKSKQHTIVPSSSLMPDSPNLLFTNAGMNQFVPIFLGQTKCPYTPGRATDTQKCIRAGGKHNDLEDVGLDTYHHTFFEMLGNWSFGDYFKKEAIAWAWELVAVNWKFPPSRVYATVFCPYLGQPGWEQKWQADFEVAKARLAAKQDASSEGAAAYDDSTADIDAIRFWMQQFQHARLDPRVHIVPGSKKDNFWMMGETGPCGPCSELHVDLTPNGDTKGSLVNKGDARCIEIWNLVFIQFNANPDGTFSPLPAKHVDTGMGFERVTSIIQGTKNLTDFASAKISNYETDIFRPIFDALEKMSGKKYTSTLPGDEFGSARVPRVVSGVAPETHPTNIPATIESTVGSKYSRRNLPHFERPWAKYMVTFATINHRQLSSKSRDIVLESLLFTDRQRRWQLFAACVMPDHVHVLFEPQIKEQDPDGKPIFWSLAELMHSVKSFTAHEINKVENTTGGVWEKESFDRMMRSDADLEEKFHYLCRNPWEAGVVPVTEPYPWLWTPGAETGSARVPRVVSGVAPETSSSQTSSEKSVGTSFSAGRLEEHAGRVCSPEIVQLDIAFRVIADHIRTLSFAIADGIQPGNNDRNYVLRRILRRAVRYGRTLGFHEPFFYKLVDVLADTMGDVFPEIRARKKQVQETIQREEEAFNKTLDRGIAMFEEVVGLMENEADLQKIPNSNEMVQTAISKETEISEDFAFQLYDTYGFPLDLTELMARERGLTVNVAGFNKLMEEQRARARAAQKKEVISLSQIETTAPTKFVGYENLTVQAKVLEVVSLKGKVGVQASACPPDSLKAGLQLAVILDTSACYAEMGGQVGDTGELTGSGQLWRVTNTQKSGNTFLHFLSDSRSNAPRSESAPERGALLRELDTPTVGSTVTLSVEKPRRDSIQRHHTVTHLLHWALHEVASKEASQKGSFVGPDKLTFDFNSAPLTPQQVADIEKLVNERIVENAPVSWIELPYSELKRRDDIRQFFGEKYGDTVRVLQIGGERGKLDGYSMELCGGTHVRATGEIGLFRIVGESAIAAGVRRIEAVAGIEAYRKAADEAALIKSLAGRVNSPVHELEKKIELMLEHQKAVEKQLKVAQQREASNAASVLLEEIKTVNGVPAIIHNLGAVDGDFLQAVADSLKGRFKGVIVLGGGAHSGSVALVATVSPEFVKNVQAGKIIQQIAPIVGGKGGGKPDNARGGGKDAGKLDEALAKAKSLLG